MKLRHLVFALLFFGVASLSLRPSFATGLNKAVVIKDADVISTADRDGSVLSKLVTGQDLFIVETSGDWTKVKLDNGIEGYVSSENIEAKKSQVATLNSLGVNLREKETPDSQSMAILNTGDKVQVLEVKGDWALVYYEEMKGYVLRKYLVLEDDKSAVSRGASREKVSSKDVSAVLAMAKSLQGRPYVYGARGPKSFDCSGFVSYVYQKSVGINLPRVSRDQARFGKRVSRNELQPGDIVSFDTNGGNNGVNHVGIYLGDGRFIHASSARVMQVTIDSLNAKHYARSFMGGSRILNP